MKNELTYLCKKKISWLIYLFIFLNIIFIEMPYVFFASPIGIFHGDNIKNGVSIINTFSSILCVIPLEASKIISEFNSDYKNTADAVGMLSAHTMDRLFTIFYMLSIVMGAMIVRKSDFQEMRQRTYPNLGECTRLIFKRYAVNVLFTTAILAIIMILPYTCLLRMKALGYSGETIQFWFLFVKWGVPTICIAYAFQIFVTVIVKEPVVTYLAHIVSFPIMLSFKENKYPFYQFVIRAGEKNPQYYQSYLDNIAINRICMIAFSMILLIGASAYLNKKEPVR